MVYNRDSLWFHLYLAYCRQIVDGDFARGFRWKAFQAQYRRRGLPDRSRLPPRGVRDALPHCRLPGLMPG